MALADPTRRSIVEMLASSGHLSATEIGNHFSVSAPAISQHLKILRNARLVRMEKRAQQRIYSVDPAGLTEMESWVVQMKKFWNARFDALEAFLQAEDQNNADKKGKSK